MIMQNDMLPVLALYERYRDGEVFLTGAFGGGSTSRRAFKGSTRIRPR